MAFYELPQALTEDIRRYEKLVGDYREQILTKDDLKAARVLMGIYEQRRDETYMVRIRLPGGAITPVQLLSLAEIARKYTQAPLHLTTRQDIQIHGVALEDTVRIEQELQAGGLSSRGGGGNCVRNVTCSFDAGVAADAAFDISPYVQALTTRLLAETDSYTLPRKFKISFSHSSQDSGLATVHDLGFIAQRNALNEQGFAVYLAGGMGTRPNVGFLLFDFVEHTEVYNITKATKNMFAKYGDRQNRHKARLRFVLYELGQEKFTQLWLAEYEAVKSAGYPPLQLPPAPLLKKGQLTIPVFLGDITLEQAGSLGKVLSKYGEDIIRITPNQNIFLRNIEETEVEALRTELRTAGFNLEITPVVDEAIACTGASTCRLGLCLSRNLLRAIKERLTACPVDLKQLGKLRLHISGCPNSCGQQGVADLGFYGMVKRHNGRIVPYYMLVAGGVVAAGTTAFAEKVEAIPAKAIPDLLYEFLTFSSHAKHQEETFPVYLKRLGLKKLKELASGYLSVPACEEKKG